MKQNLSTVKRSIFYLAFCFSLLFCFSCIGRFSTVGNVVAASQPKVTVKTRAAAEINKRVTCTKSCSSWRSSWQSSWRINYNSEKSDSRITRL